MILAFLVALLGAAILAGLSLSSQADASHR